ncbi:MAG: Phosphoserine phosphatase [Pseudomonadota bacterium]|jgi:phosphoserine phosphatase
MNTHTHTHLTSGLQATLDNTLYQIFIKALGQPIRTDARHAVWETPANTALRQAAQQAEHDVAQLSPYLSWRDFSVLAMDMDSTLINIECIDEIADYCGKKHEVAKITEATMRGEITDFNESLRRRVALLKGLPLTALQAVLDHRLQLNPGAERLTQSAHSHNIVTLLVSGGFTFFTDAMQARLGLTHAYSNTLNHNSTVLDGTLQEPIVNAEVKRNKVQSLCEQMGVRTTRAIAVGDGSNDLAMMAIAGLSVAYHAKPAVQAKAMAVINYGGLDTLDLWLS